MKKTFELYDRKWSYKGQNISEETPLQAIMGNTILVTNHYQGICRDGNNTPKEKSLKFICQTKDIITLKIDKENKAKEDLE